MLFLNILLGLVASMTVTVPAAINSITAVITITTTKISPRIIGILVSVQKLHYGSNAAIKLLQLPSRQAVVRQLLIVRCYRM